MHSHGGGQCHSHSAAGFGGVACHGAAVKGAGGVIGEGDAAAAKAGGVPGDLGVDDLDVGAFPGAEPAALAGGPADILKDPAPVQSGVRGVIQMDARAVESAPIA